MKYVLALLLGLATGGVLFGIGLAYTPFFGNEQLSPLAVSDSQTLMLGYPAVTTESIVFTNDGESRVHPHPEKVLQLWEAPIRQSSVMAVVLWDSRNETAGLGIKFASTSQSTRLLDGRAIVDSVWYLYLPGRGSLFVEQTENYWDFLRDIVFPAYRSSADTWRGQWLGNMTDGPGALGTAKVTGGSGDFLGQSMLGVESMSVRAWRVDRGVLAGEGQLVIELPTHPSNDPASGDEEL
ncbi:MAG: hypothetical protein OEY74_04385 [Gammaproteobacteria bacterium]|nr:hypothetical protein [Gammaproteobacteria bacterium]